MSSNKIPSLKLYHELYQVIYVKNKSLKGLVTTILYTDISYLHFVVTFIFRIHFKTNRQNQECIRIK